MEAKDMSTEELIEELNQRCSGDKTDLFESDMYIKRNDRDSDMIELYSEKLLWCVMYSDGFSSDALSKIDEGYYIPVKLVEV